MTKTGVEAELKRLNKPADKMEDMELTGEEEIVWIEDISEFDYVRVSLTDEFAKNRGQPDDLSSKIRRVGYANLSKDVSDRARRRIFWIKESDRTMENEMPGWWFGAPSEAIDPRTVDVNKRGLVTWRVLGLENLCVEVRKNTEEDMEGDQSSE